MPRSCLRFAFLVSSLVCLVVASARAHAQTTPETSVTASPANMDNVVSAFGLFSYWYADAGLGIGVRFQKTLVPGGVLKLPTLHEEIGIEGGLDYFHYGFDNVGYNWTYNEYALLVGGVWNFWFLGDKLAVYPKIEIGYRFGSWSTNTGVTSPGGYGGLVVQGSAGVVYKISRVTLRAEAGSGSLRLGAGFAL